MKFPHMDMALSKNTFPRILWESKELVIRRSVMKSDHKREIFHSYS